MGVPQIFPSTLETKQDYQLQAEVLPTVWLCQQICMSTLFQAFCGVKPSPTAISGQPVVLSYIPILSHKQNPLYPCYITNVCWCFAGKPHCIRISSSQDPQGKGPAVLENWRQEVVRNPALTTTGLNWGQNHVEVGKKYQTYPPVNWHSQGDPTICRSVSQGNHRLSTSFGTFPLGP